MAHLLQGIVQEIGISAAGVKSCRLDDSAGPGATDSHRRPAAQALELRCEVQHLRVTSSGCEGGGRSKLQAWRRLPRSNASAFAAIHDLQELAFEPLQTGAPSCWAPRTAWASGRPASALERLQAR